MQILRTLRELGVIRIMIGAVVVTIGSTGLAKAIQTAEHPEIGLVLTALVLLAIHLQRMDKTFFELYARRATHIYQIEYMLMVSPLVAMFLAFGFWQISIGIMLIALTVPFIGLKTRSITFNSKLQRLIPASAIEWKSGVRKMLIPLVLVWSVGLLGSYFIPAVPIAILLIGMLVSGFYEKMESLPILLADELSPTRFLRNKIRVSLALFSLLNMPLIMAFTIFHPAQFYIAIAAFVLFGFLLIYAICLKYAFYLPEPGASGNQMLLAIGLMGIFIPFMLPLFLFFIFRFYFKAKSNLNLYFHDFN